VAGRTAVRLYSQRRDCICMRTDVACDAGARADWQWQWPQHELLRGGSVPEVTCVAGGVILLFADHVVVALEEGMRLWVEIRVVD